MLTFFFWLIFVILFYIYFMLTRIFNLRSQTLLLLKLSLSAETQFIYPSKRMEREDSKFLLSS